MPSGDPRDCISSNKTYSFPPSYNEEYDEWLANSQRDLAALRDLYTSTRAVPVTIRREPGNIYEGEYYMAIPAEPAIEETIEEPETTIVPLRLNHFIEL